MIGWPAIPEGETSMLLENYEPGDWTNGEIETGGRCGMNTKHTVPGTAFNRKNQPAPLLG
jgi:hypothetical protein